MRWNAIGVALAVAAAACGKGRDGKAGGGAGDPAQSFRDGVDLICRANAGAAGLAPATRDRVMWSVLDRRLHDPDARALAARLRAERDGGEAVLRAAARRVGLTGCPLIADGHVDADPWGELPVTRIATGAGTEGIDRSGPLVVVGAASIAIEGKDVAPLDHGRVPVAAGATAAGIPAVRAWAEARDGAGPPSRPRPPVQLLVAPDVPAATVAATIASFAPMQPWVLLVVEQDREARCVPIDLPAAGATDDDGEWRTDPKLVLELTGDRAMLWSMTGLEGTRDHPALAVPRDAEGAWLGKVQAALADVVARRFGDVDDRADGRRIVVLADGDVPAGDEIAAAAAARRDPRGRTLFPHVRLGLPAAPTAAAGRPAPSRPDKGAEEREVEKEAQAMADLLTSDGAADQVVLGRRQSVADLSAEITAARDAGATIGGGSRGSAAIGPGGGPGGARPPATPLGRVAVEGVSAADDTTLTGRQVASRIQAVYLPGLTRCYRAELATDPTLHGRLVLRFDVTAGGRVTAPQADAPTPALGACLAGQLARWRFPVPTGADGSPARASFEVTLQLRPA